MRSFAKVGISFFFIVFFFVSFALIINVQSITQEEWFNISWDYRKNITVNTTAGYPLRIAINMTELYEAGKMDADCNDTRFTNETGTELDFWIQDCVTDDNATNTIVFVEPDASLSEGIIQFYYGNADGSDASNGTNTFGWFDDIEDGDITDWIDLIQTNESNLKSFEGNYSIRQNDDSASTGAVAYYSLPARVVGVFHYAVYIEEGTGIPAQFTMFDGATAGINLRYDNGYFTYQTGGTWTNFSTPVPYSFDTWYRVEIYWNATNSTGDVYVDGLYKGQALEQAAISSINKTRINSGYSTPTEDEAYWDVLFADNWTESDSHTPTLGSEESAPPPENSTPETYAMSPDNDTWNTSLTINHIGKCIGNSLTNASLYNNMSGWSLKHSNTSSLSSGANFTIQEVYSADGNYLWAIECCNATGCNITSNLTLKIDSTSPVLSVASPENKTYPAINTSIHLNVSVVESNVDTYFYNLNSGTNTTFTPNTTITVTYGLNNLLVYVNDSAGNINSSQVYFTLFFDVDEDSLIDDYWIEEKINITRDVISGTRDPNNPIFEANTSLCTESGSAAGILSAHIEKINSTYHLWYRSENSSGIIFSLYANSTNLTEFVRPTLNSYLCAGSTANNIYMSRNHATFMPDKMYYNASASNVSEIFVVVGRGSQQFSAAVGSEPTTFSTPVDLSSLTGSSDGTSAVIFNGTSWIMYFQDYGSPRKIGWAYNDDISPIGGTWTVSGVIADPGDYPEDQHHEFISWTHPRSGAIYGFMGEWIDADGSFTGTALWVSRNRNGTGWSKVGNQSKLGAIWLVNSSSTWDNGTGMYLKDTPLEENNNWTLAYTGCPGANGGGLCAMGLLRWRYNGMVDLESNATMNGTIQTKLINITSKGTLSVNVNATGSTFHVELLDKDNNTITNYAKADFDVITTNEYNKTVTWSGSSALPTTTNSTKIKFYLEDGTKFYSYIVVERIPASTITINLPANNTTSSDLFNFSFSKIIDTAKYSIDGGANVTNISISEWTGTFGGLSDGFHNVSVWVNDSSNNVNQTTRYWTRGTTYPTLIIVLPVNTTYNDETALQLNFSYIESSPDTCWYELIGDANVTLANCDTNGTSMNTGGDDGIRWVRLCGNDTIGNGINCTIKYWTVDITEPKVTILSPINNYTTNNIWFNVTLSADYSGEGNQTPDDTCLVDYGYGNKTLTNSSGNWNYNNASMSDGSYQAKFYCNDTAGNMNNTENVNFTIDAIPEYYPSYGSTYYNTFLYNYSNPINISNFTSCWFILNDLPLQNFTCGAWNTTINTNLGINNLTICWINGSLYQEDANATSCSGDWIASSCPFSYDGNWDTTGQCVTSNAYLFVNYTKPSGSIGADWEIKTTITHNDYAIPNDCWDESPLQFRVTSICASVESEFDCWNGTGWKRVFRDHLSVSIYEEAIWWSMSNYAGVTFCNETLFNVSILCNGSHINDTICGGKDFSYLLKCKRIGRDTYQFDYTNMTYCEYGCIDGECINRTFCLDQCVNGETMCNRNYVISCALLSNGCWDWSIENQTYCQEGCLNGKCLDCLDFCNWGDKKCEGNLIKHCDDDNGDGCFEFSESNTTFCEWGCKEEYNSTTDFLNVTCNYHSFDDITTVKNTLFAVGGSAYYIFDTLYLKVWITLILMIGVGGIAAKFGKSWRLGLMVMTIIIFASSWVGWMPWVVTIIFGLFVGGVWFHEREEPIQ